MDNKHINMTDSCWLVLYFFVAKFDATQMNSIWWRICFWIQNFRRGLAVKCRVFLLEISWSWEIRLWLCTIEFWSVINPTAVGVCRPFFLKQQGVVYYKIKCSVVILMCSGIIFDIRYHRQYGNTRSIVVLVELYKFFSARVLIFFERLIQGIFGHNCED